MWLVGRARCLSEAVFRKLQTIVINEVLQKFVKQLGALLGEDSSEADIASAVQSLQNDSFFPEPMMKLMQSSEGRRLLQNAKMVCQQRKMDDTLAVELQDIDATLKKLKTQIGGVPASVQDADSSLVRMSFTVKSLASLAIRAKAVNSKASDHFKKNNSVIVANATGAVTNLATAMLQIKGAVLWRALFESSDAPFPFLCDVMSRRELSRQRSQRVIDLLSNRVVVQAAALPSDVGFASLLDDATLRLTDNQWKKLARLVECLVGMVSAVEMETETQAAEFDMFSPAMKKLWGIMKDELSVYDLAARATVFPGVSAEDVTAKLEMWNAVLLAAATNFGEDIIRRNQWFVRVYLEGKKMQWPNTFPETDTDLPAQLIFAASLIQTLGDALDSVQRMKFLTLKYFDRIVTIGKQVQDLSGVMKCNATDTKTFETKKEKVECLALSIIKLTEDANAEGNAKVVEFLNSQLSGVKTDYKNIVAAIVGKFQSLVNTPAAIVDTPKLDFAKQYDGAFDATRVMQQVARSVFLYPLIFQNRKWVGDLGCSGSE